MVRKWIIFSLILLFLVANIHYAINHGFLRNVFYSKNASKEIQVRKDKTSRFLIEMNNSGLRDAEIGLLAAEKGTTVLIRQYGLLMIKSKTIYKTRIEDIAKARNVILPTRPGPMDVDNWLGLKLSSGKKFDALFIETIENNYKKDKKELKLAMELGDNELQDFAEEYLDYIEQMQLIPKL